LTLTLFPATLPNSCPPASAVPGPSCWCCSKVLKTRRAITSSCPDWPMSKMSFADGHKPCSLDLVAKQYSPGTRLHFDSDAHQIAVLFRGHHDDGRLLPALSQRRQQLALAVRLANSQMLPSQVELVKLQLHGRATESEYARNRNWSFAGKGEVSRELPWDQRDTGGFGLSRYGPLVLP
jgi:hypothetical protein